MTPAEAKAYLHSFTNYELKPNTSYAASFNLKRVFRLFHLLGNPEKNLKILHVAGTKGKGSTCIFAASILRSAGYAVGLYTSPHLSDEKERVRILRPQRKTKRLFDPFEGKISETSFCKLLGKIKTAVQKLESRHSERPTFFEIYTAIALLYFKENKVDFAVLETGLGGRLDATNATRALVSAITPISMEHTQQLGKTLEKIATEKAAIIKKKQIAIIAPQEKQALAVLKRQCKAVGTKYFLVGKDIRPTLSKISLSGQAFSIKGIYGEYKNLTTKLLGNHQAVNAAVAVGMVEALGAFGYRMSAQAIRQGLKNACWPGRFEVIHKKPLVILDGAHNPGSCRKLAESTREILSQKNITLVLGAAQDKDHKGILRELQKIANRVIFTKANHPRAFDFENFNMNGFSKGKEIIYTQNVKEALQEAMHGLKVHGAVLVTGSLYVVGEARELCSRS